MVDTQPKIAIIVFVSVFSTSQEHFALSVQNYNPWLAAKKSQYYYTTGELHTLNSLVFFLLSY